MTCGEPRYYKTLSFPETESSRFPKFSASIQSNNKEQERSNAIKQMCYLPPVCQKPHLTQVITGENKQRFIERVIDTVGGGWGAKLFNRTAKTCTVSPL